MALDVPSMNRIIQAFAHAARLAHSAGLNFVELHAAHGYLLHSFLSPISNHRSDGYGGSLQNRMRFPLDVVREVRRAWPEDKTLGIRINGTDWIENGWGIDDAVAFARCLVEEGIDYLSISSGGARSGVPIKLEPGYQIHLATAIRAAVECPVVCAGLIADAHLAESIVADERADFVALARAMLDDPCWAIHAAVILGGNARLPAPYQLAAAGKWPLATRAAR
jgi:2,4-dienoyl-CoA reductase-like NADH-dependent reductase (Old Yellow Enzyme family)